MRLAVKKSEWKGLGWLLSKLGMIILAITIVGPWEGTKRLHRRVFASFKDWFDGVIYALVDVGVTAAGSIYAGELVRSHGHSWLAWLPAGLVAFFVGVGYISPIAYLIAARPLWHTTEDIWKAIRSFAKNHFENASAALVMSFARLPGALTLWNKILDPDRKSGAVRLIKVVLYPTLVLASGWLGYSIYLQAGALTHLLAGLAPALVALSPALVSLAVSILAGAVGFVVFATVADVLCKFLHYGKLPGLAILLGIGSALVVGHIALTFGWIAALCAFAIWLVLSTTYLVPLTLLLFSDHFLAFVIDTLKPLLESAYDQTENPARRLMGQAINLGTSLLAAWGTIALCSAIALPLWGTALVLAVTVALAYTLGGKVWDWDGGNYLFGVVLSLLSGCAAAYGYHHFAFWFCMYGAISVGVFTALFVFLLLYPLALLGYQKVANCPRLSKGVGAISGWLVSAHDAVWTRFDQLVDQCEKIYDFGYRDERPYNLAVLHLTNVLLTSAVPVVLLVCAHGFVLAHPILAAIVIALATAAAYLLGGRCILKVGLELVGALFALAGGITVGVLTAPAQALGMALAAPLGILSAGLIFFLLYPALFIAIRYIADPCLPNLVLTPLSGLFNRAWARFGKWWNGFVAVYRFIVAWLGKKLTALFGWLAPYWTGFVALCSAAWNSTFGR